MFPRKMFSGRMFASRMFPPVISNIIEAISDIITVTLSDAIKYITSISLQVIRVIGGNELLSNQLVATEALVSSSQSSDVGVWNSQVQESSIGQVTSSDNVRVQINNSEELAGYVDISDTQNQSILNNEVER